MRKLNFKIKDLSGYLVFAFLLSATFSYAQKPSPGLPPAFEKAVPLDMKYWYDGDTLNGEIELDVRRSTANWEPFTPQDAPPGAPNILFVLYDDTGLAAWSPFGGKIKMPTLDALAAEGLRYSQWHTTALCSPTRSTILTGRNHHLNGMAAITETADGFPGANGRVPDNCLPFAQVLQNNGYSTFWVGKNHNVPENDVAPGGYRGEWPCQIGFDRFYGFLGGETNNWYPDLVEDNHFIEAPYTPDKGYHLSKDLADKSIEMLRNQNASHPSKPWYLWFNPGANHAPHHSPKEFTKMYTDEKTFEAGYEVYRTEILASMIDEGIIPEGTAETALNFLDSDVYNPLDTITPWADLDTNTQKLFVRMAEVYAGFSTYTDYQVGRIIDYLKDSGQYENTIILYAADNGASGEGTPPGSVNENKFFNGYPDEIEENMKYMESLGTEATYNHFPTGWAAAFSTPFKMFKRYSQFAGGTNDPLVISWPKYMDSTGVNGQIRHQYHHSVDIVPTLLEAIKLEMPRIHNGIVQKPLSGESMMYTFNNIDPFSQTNKKVQYYCMLGTRGIWKDGYKAVALHAPTSGKSNFDTDGWELYHVAEDRSESKNLATDPAYKDKLEDLQRAWFVQAARNNVLPLDDRVAPELIGVERPSSEPHRNVYRYYPNTAAVPEGVAVNIRGRSYEIVGDVEVDPMGKVSGVIFAHGSRFGGHTLYVKNGRLRYFYNFLGIESESREFESDIILSPGRHIVKAAFQHNPKMTDPFGAAHGNLSLYIGNKLVDSGDMKTQPAKFSLSGDGLCIGYDSADAITTAYDTEKGEFTGGTINSVVVNVTGKPIINLKAAARAMMLKQ